MQEVVDVHSPHAERLLVVPENLKTPPPAAVYAVVPPAEARRRLTRLAVHDPPKHGSWLKMAESAFGVLTQQCLDRRLPDHVMVEREVAAWEHRRNTAGARVDWRFTTEDARIKLKHLYPSMQS